MFWISGRVAKTQGISAERYCGPSLVDRDTDGMRASEAIAQKGLRDGVVTLSLIDWNLPTAADFDAWYFKGLACRSIVHIGPISLNMTMPGIPPREHATRPITKIGPSYRRHRTALHQQPLDC
jgi:hypothetical protein